MKTETMSDSLKFMPPAAVAAAHTIYGLKLEEWVSVLTIMYLIFLIGEKIYKAWRAARAERIKQTGRTIYGDEPPENIE